MVNQVLLYISSTLLFLWGIAHLFSTGSVVQGFGEISEDNRRIITMEWIVEGVTLEFIGLLVAGVTVTDRTSAAAWFVYFLSFIMLNTLSAISLFTGFRIKFLPFKLCPFIFTTSSILIALGAYL